MSTVCKRFIRPHKGQNLVELALVLPFLMILIFAIVEIGRVWQCYQGTKMAAIDGAYTASLSYGAGESAAISAGQTQMLNRLAAANLMSGGTTMSVLPVKNNGGTGAIIGFKAAVQTQFRPIVGAISLPTMSGPVPIIPAAFPISYDNIQFNAVY